VEYYWRRGRSYIIFADGVFFYAEWVGSRGNGTAHETRSGLLSSEIAFIAPLFVFELTVHPPPHSAQSIFPISIFQTAVHVCFHHDTLSRKLNVSSEVERDGKSDEERERIVDRCKIGR
jgi:hypothetical protein